MRISRPAVCTIHATPADATAPERHGGPCAARRIGGGVLAFFLVLVLAAVLVPAAPSQAFGAVVDSGTDGECTWILTDYNNYTLTIKPTNGISGRLSEYRSGTLREWQARANSARNIAVEKGVTAQGDMQSLFSGMAHVETITLPNWGFDQGITNAQNMFTGCTALLNLTLPNGFGSSITNARSMFSDCPALESVALPDNFGGDTMQADGMFDGSPLLSIIYMGENCNGSILAQVPDASRDEYADTWVRAIEDADYDDGVEPSELQADYENAGSPSSTYVRQHAENIAPDVPKAHPGSDTGVTIEVYLENQPNSGAFATFSHDSLSWQSSYIFSGLDPYTTYNGVQARFAGPAYKLESKSTPVSVTTRGRITYDANGGSGTTKPTDGEFSTATSAPAADCTFTAPEVSVLETCTFKEWNALPDGEGARYLPGDSVVFETGGNTLYAVWEVHPIPRITTTDLPAAMRGEAYSQKLSATVDAPVTWSIESGSALPEGLALASDGTLSGTPEVAGSFSFAVEARNVYGGVGTAEFTLEVTGSPIISTGSLPDAVVGEPYSQKLSAIGYPDTFTWSLKSGSSLPEGLALASDGTLSGTAKAPGTVRFTVRVANGIAPDAVKELLLTVRAATPVNADDPKDQGGLAAAGDAVASPAAGLTALVLACSAGLASLALRRRVAKR